jgi:hypothetical protein
MATVRPVEWFTSEPAAASCLPSATLSATTYPSGQVRNRRPLPSETIVCPVDSRIIGNRREGEEQSAAFPNVHFRAHANSRFFPLHLAAVFPRCLLLCSRAQ